MSKVELKIRGSQLGMAGFEQNLKQLKGSQLMKNSEFIDMFRTVEKFHHDMKLSYLTCRDKSYLVQQAEDAQFYHILINMMQEISNIRGIKQREEVKKLYRWFKANRGVLHSSPHFKGSTQQLYKRPLLKFADDALNFYSVPLDKRNKSPKKVNFSDGKTSGFSTNKSNPRPGSKGIIKSFEGLGVSRPLTAPPGLHRPKVENNLPSPPKVVPPAADAPSLTAHYLIHKVSPGNSEHDVRNRPSTAIGLIRLNNSPVDDLSGSSSNPSTDINQNTKKSLNIPSTNNELAHELHSTPSEYTDSVNEEDSITQNGEKQEEDQKLSKFPIPHLVNPVAQHHFLEENYDDGPAPENVFTLRVDVPVDTEVVQSAERVSESKLLDKWKEYQDSQTYGQDIIGKHQFFGRSGSPSGVRYTVHDGWERPELYTQQVISSFALEQGPPKVEQSTREALHYQSLEDFYKSMEDYKPGKKSSAQKFKVHSSKSAEPIRGYIADEIAEEIQKSGKSPTGNSKSTKVHFESIVDLTENVGDEMTNTKEKLSPEPKAGFRQPSVGVKQDRPQTAPSQAARIMLFDAPPIPPPNSARPASTSTNLSVDYTPRNKKGEPIFQLPEGTEYTVHIRPDERNQSRNVVPHAIRHGQVSPRETSRYKWQDEGLRNLTCSGSKRSTASRCSPRSAGGNIPVRRPKTAAEESMKKRWNTERDHNQRVPQAASHVTTMMQPQTIASMVVVNHLGTENRRLRSRMGNTSGITLEEEFFDIPATMEFVPFSSPVPLQVRGHNDFNSENQDLNQVSSTLNTSTDKDVDNDSLLGHKDDFNSSRASTAPSLTSEIEQLDNENMNKDDENQTSLNDTRDEEMSTADTRITDEMENNNDNAESLAFEAPSPITVEVPSAKQDDADFSPHSSESDTENIADKRHNIQAIDNFVESSEILEVQRTHSMAETELKKKEQEDTKEPGNTDEDEVLQDAVQATRLQRGRSSQRPSSASSRLSPRDVESTSRPSTGGRLREVKLSTDVDRNRLRVYNSSDSFIPSIYIGLQDEHKLMTHPTGLSKPALEFGVMMPQVQKMILSPRENRRGSPASRPSSSRPRRNSSPQYSSREASPSPRREIFIGIPSSHKSDSTNSLISEDQSMDDITPDSPSSEEPFSSQESPSSRDRVCSQDTPSIQKHATPRILIKRPSSAPLFNNSRPDGMSQFRPVSPASQSERRSFSPHSSSTSPVVVQASSARAKPKGKEWNGRPLPVFGESTVVDDAAVEKIKQAKESVKIRDLFSSKASRQYMKEKERRERLKWEKMQKEDEENFRTYQEQLWRRDMALLNRSDITYHNWEKEYMADKALRERMRLDKMNSLLHKQGIQNKKTMSYLKRIGPHVDVWELFHGEKRGISKGQMKRAVTTIQKYVRGWIVRKKLKEVKLKSRVHAATFKKFLDLYCGMMKRIAHRYLVKKPRIYFDLWQLDEFMERKRHYEYVFAKRAHPGDELEMKDLEIYFKECDHYPSITEIHDAVRHVTKKDPEKPGLKLKEAQVIETSFQIYVPPGCGLTTDQTRKSTWLNPLVNGVEAKRLMGSSEVEKAQLRKSMSLVFGVFRERKEEEELKNSAETTDN
ncbi:uncharacterized protein LOC117108121 isoform X2 [Anneissia japonica]|uniref:uncharacterized protein LOC117108121 isoform X2 n=1 Tax=Anneissia japonica TaxID=1529436 RepID=UPI0014257968|nr:uncharacterized protein LOC117108121 isoform X2 [Anneissia japonica]